MKAQMAKGENVMVAVKAGGHGELGTNEVAWKQTIGLPYVPSPLFYHGRVYLVRDGGMVSCFDAKTGTSYYQKERLDAAGSYYASPVAADGRIYFVSLNGRVTVVAAAATSRNIKPGGFWRTHLRHTGARGKNALSAYGVGLVRVWPMNDLSGL